MIWSVDAALDEVLTDAKATLSSGDSATTEVVEEAQEIKKNAEKDKEVLQAIVKRLLVCVLRCSFL
jgi:THO complex subunit 2